MADDLTSNPWVIDSTGAKTSNQVRIARIAWKNASALNDTVLIVDGNGKTIFEDFASGATYNVSEPIARVYDGVTVSTLSSGKLYLHLDVRPRRE
jgi:hypothetical protein